jgi:hypothetical protein
MAGDDTVIWRDGFMRRSMMILAILFLAPSSIELSYAETWTPLRGAVELRDRPQVNGKVLARIPAKTHLKELDKRWYWIKVEYQGKIGWIPLGKVRLVTGEEKPKIQVIHTHTKRIRGMYKHIFKIRNTGSVPFSGAVTLKGYISDDQAFIETFTYREQPIPARQGREAIVNIESDFSRLEYTVKQ